MVHVLKKKPLLNLLQYCFCFGFCHEICGRLASRPGIEPSHPGLEGKVLTTGPPGKLQWYFLKAMRTTGLGGFLRPSFCSPDLWMKVEGRKCSKMGQVGHPGEP